MLPQRHDPRADHVRPAARADPEHHRDRLRHGEHAGGPRRGVAALVVEVENEEAEEHRLRGHVQAASPREQPEAPVAQRPLDLRRLHALARQLAHDRVADQRASRRRTPEEEERRRERPTTPRGRGSTSAPITPPTGTAVWRTPNASPRSRGGNHCMTARPLADWTLAPARRRARTARRPRARSRTRPIERDETPQRASPSASARRSPIRSVDEAPRQQRERQPDPLRREEEPDALQAEVVLLAERRRHRRQAERDRREARLRRRARGEHRPAVVRAS